MQILTLHDDHRSAIADALGHVPDISVDAEAPMALLARCPVAGRTPLRRSDDLARAANVGHVHVKDERGRMGLGSFKALGAAYVIARDAEAGEAAGRTYVTASAGNHGLSVAAGAAAFGARSIVLIAETVPESFAQRLREIGAEVRRAGATYEDSMTAAVEVAEAPGHVLLSDSAWEGYVDRPATLMEGYLVLMAEAVEDMTATPTHIFLQAGVGGLAAAAAVYARASWGDAPRIVVVEPDAAPALHASIAAGKVIETEGPASAMGRLDCKVPSILALKALARDASDMMTITEDEGQAGCEAAADADLASTPSGAAGIAGMLAAATAGALGLDRSSRVLVIVSECAET